MEKKWSVSEIIHYRRVGVINRRIGGSKSCLTAHSPSASRDRMERFHAGEELPADPGFTEHRTGRGLIGLKRFRVIFTEVKAVRKSTVLQRRL